MLLGLQLPCMLLTKYLFETPRLFHTDWIVRIQVKLGYNELGYQRTLGYHEHILR
jgi:hypothetical protein